MTAPKLYTAEVLSLATSLASWPLDPDMPLQGRARSQSCGSTLSMSLCLDEGKIAGIGLAAQACAIGQASAAIFAAHAIGRTAREIAETGSELENWLKEGAELPAWPGLEALSAARAYPARHGAMMLPWRAGMDALSQSPSAG